MASKNNPSKKTSEGKKSPKKKYAPPSISAAGNLLTGDNPLWLASAVVP
jgi:hypothetical protein